MSEHVHVFPLSEEAQHVTEGFPEKVCWCPFRVEWIAGLDGVKRAVVSHERRDN